MPVRPGRIDGEITEDSPRPKVRVLVKGILGAMPRKERVTRRVTGKEELPRIKVGVLQLLVTLLEGAQRRKLIAKFPPPHGHTSHHRSIDIRFRITRADVDVVVVSRPDLHNRHDL